MIPKEPSDAARSGDFPQFPGEEVYSHAAALYQEKAEARLASLGLLAAAEGLPSEATKAIVDIDLDELPALDPSHKEYHRRQTDRTKIAAQNRANESKRFAITMAEWTTIYSPTSPCRGSRAATGGQRGSNVARSPQEA